MKWTGGKLIKEQWCVDGTIHRLDGPAITTRDAGGAVISEQWRYRNSKVTLDELAVMLKPERYRAAFASLPQPIFEEIWEVFVSFVESGYDVKKRKKGKR
jgi:hypothetical protein